MTIRAVLLGLFGAAFICGITYFNDAVIHQTNLVGNYLPLFVYGGLVLFVLTLYPLGRVIFKKWALSGTEIAVVLALTLCACCIPGSGLMRIFTTTLVTPKQYALKNPAWQTPPDGAGWRKTSLTDQVPQRMLVNVTPDNTKTVLDPLFSGGLDTPKTKTKLSDIPWSAWITPLRFWIPALLIFWCALIGLSLVVHRQWADHEQLPYPIAVLANELLPKAKETFAQVFRNKIFWFGLIAVAAIHLNNFACLWHPEMIQFPMKLYFWQLTTQADIFMKGGGWQTLQPSFYFTVIAFAYFLATDVSLALGIGPFIWYYVAGTCAGVGITAVGGSGHIDSFLAFGAYLGMFCVLLYTGRHYYSNAFRGAFCLPYDQRIKPESVWGARLFLLAITGFICYVSILGKLDWQFATVFAGLATLLFLVLSRIVAETGVFFIQPGFTPAIVMLGLFGMTGIGPQTILILTLLSIIMLIDPRESLMPFLTNGFKLLDQRQVKVGKFAAPALLALTVGLAVAIPATLYFQYAHGLNIGDAFAAEMVPSMPYNAASDMETKLAAQGQLATVAKVTGWGHFAHIAPNGQSVLALCIGLGLVLLFTFARLRFSKWPIHPVLFLVWVTYPASWFAPSFLVGWFIKSLVMKYGGGALYRNLKPLMFGLIAGEMVAGFIITVIGAIYWFTTGQPPKSFSIMPG